MNELARHIEKLLQESDFAIIPGFGGFIAHYTPAIRDTKNNMFLPPTRTIGFNAKLTLNDGLLAQSYMSANRISSKEAYSLIHLAVREMHSQLEENGKLELEAIGTLCCDANNKYTFKPEVKAFESPLLYGFAPFEIQEIQHKVTDQKKVVGTKTKSNSHSYQANYLGSLALVMIAMASLFLFSTPVENTEVISTNQANLLPSELWKEVNRVPLTTTPLITNTENNQIVEENHIVAESPAINESNKLTYSQIAPSKKEVIAEEYVQDSEITEIATTTTTETVEEPKPKVVTPTKTSYHIIVASAIRSDYADILLDQLKDEGFKSAQILNNNGRTRVSAVSFDTKEEAYKELRNISANTIYHTAWVFKLD